MRRSLFAAGSLVALAACGGSSTGPNINPHPVNHAISISNTGFTPETTQSKVQDTVTWTSSEGSHAFSFIAALSPDSLAPSGAIAQGQSKFAVFIRAGTYTYLDDSIRADTGVVIVQ